MTATKERKPTLEELMGAYDWKEAMKYAQFRFDQIERVLLAREGEGDGPDWLLLVELKGGGYGALRAGCDYTGWGCQEGGSSGVFESVALAKAWFIKEAYRDDEKDGSVFVGVPDQ